MLYDFMYQRCLPCIQDPIPAPLHAGATEALQLQAACAAEEIEQLKRKVSAGRREVEELHGLLATARAEQLGCELELKERCKLDPAPNPLPSCHSSSCVYGIAAGPAEAAARTAAGEAEALRKDRLKGCTGTKPFTTATEGEEEGELTLGADASAAEGTSNCAGRVKGWSRGCEAGRLAAENERLVALLDAMDREHDQLREAADLLRIQISEAQVMGRAGEEERDKLMREVGALRSGLHAAEQVQATETAASEMPPGIPEGESCTDADHHLHLMEHQLEEERRLRAQVCMCEGVFATCPHNFMLQICAMGGSRHVKKSRVSVKADVASCAPSCRLSATLVSCCRPWNR